MKFKAKIKDLLCVVELELLNAIIVHYFSIRKSKIVDFGVFAFSVNVYFQAKQKQELLHLMWGREKLCVLLFPSWRLCAKENENQCDQSSVITHYKLTEPNALNKWKWYTFTIEKIKREARGVYTRIQNQIVRCMQNVECATFVIHSNNMEYWVRGCAVKTFTNATK